MLNVDDDAAFDDDNNPNKITAANTNTTAGPFTDINNVINGDAGPIDVNNVTVAAEFESSDNIDINMVDHTSNNNDDDFDMDMRDMNNHLRQLNSSKVTKSSTHGRKRKDEKNCFLSEHLR